MGDRDVDRPGSRRLSRADARLRRPVVDPAIPRTDRTLLTDPRTPLTPACQSRPARRRDYLPREPGRRLATVDGAAIGLTGAMMIAVFGTVPLAVGVIRLSPGRSCGRSMAFAICSSTDLLSQPRAISSFYGEFAATRPAQ